MLRKHLNSLDIKEYKAGKVPFYAWQCVTLQLPHRDVDLVIKDDRDMDHFLMVLIHWMRTVDGNAKSITYVENKIKETKLKQMMRSMKNNFYNLDSLKKKALVSQDEEECVMRATLFKYKLMRIRCKISFCAFEKGLTIVELFMKQIQTSFDHFVKLKEI
jgi:hypothetical protein